MLPQIDIRNLLSWVVMLVTIAIAQASKPIDRPTVIPLPSYIGLLRSISVTIGGRAHSFIFDTGGGETMISPTIAAAIRCAPYGRAVGFRMSGEQVVFGYCDDVALRLGNVVLQHDRAAVFDLKSILPAGLPPAQGVVSLRSFRRNPVTIDYANGTITIETSDSLAERTKSMRPVTFRVASGPTGGETTLYLGARVGGRRVWLLLDSGNGDRALMSSHVAAMAGVKGNEGEVLVEFDELGRERLPTRSRDIIYDGVLGAAFMQDWVFTIDLPSNRVWATAADKPASR